MKAKLTMVLLAIMLFVATAGAQESKNMEFMGIPIAGNVNDFSSKLTAKGFRLQQRDEGVITMSGKFTNQKVTVALIPVAGTNDIYRVGVRYEPNSSWDSLESHQNYLVEQYTKKYGDPSNSERKIDRLYEDHGNYIFSGFYNDRVKYSDSWALQKGSILITIRSASYNSASIVILYEDNASAKVIEDNILDEI